MTRSQGPSSDLRGKQESPYSLPSIVLCRHHTMDWCICVLEMEKNMVILAILALSTTDDGVTRLILLLLVLLAVILILTGSIIALLTLRKRRKMYNSYINSTQVESERT
jgi:hypothetical protein